MDWRAKVELFEEIRREYEFGAGTVMGVAKKLGVHRRMVREALGNAVPSQRKKPERNRAKVTRGGRPCYCPLCACSSLYLYLGV